jgi:hypothetical protein
MTARGVGSLVPSVSTIQSFQTAETTPQRKKGLFAGIFDVALIAIPSLRIVIASPQPILTSRLCGRKFRSWQLNSERKRALGLSEIRRLELGRYDPCFRYCVLSPSASNWPLHSAEGSRSRSTPIPRGRRPWTAARTRSGARNASEMVILTWRTLHFSRVAICSTSVIDPDRISSSQRRPRAMALTRRARRSIRVGRTSLLGTPCGSRICLALLDGGFCHGIDKEGVPAPSDVSSGSSEMN